MDVDLGDNRRVPIPGSPFDLCRVLEEAAALVATQAAQKKIELAVRYAPGVPRGFDGDAGRIRQVMLNLIENAIESTVAGYVLAEVTAEEDRGDVWIVRLAVEDTGIGIPASEQPRLFHEFERLESAARFEGRGLGLAISKRLIELMGGKIGFESRRGTGSIFWFTLPLKLAPEACHELSPRIREWRPRVLVAAPRSLSRKLLTEVLGQWEMRVHHVEAPEDVPETLRCAEEAGAPFALVVLDLPDSGDRADAVVSSLGRDPRFRRAVVLLLGAAGVSKPAGPWALERALTALLAGTPPATRRWAWRVLLVEDNAVSQRVTLAELKSLGCQAEVAANGSEAIDRVTANSYDLVFMDCVMPGMDGFEATRRIRGIEGDRRHTVIVGMTGRAWAEDRQRCREAGMDDYLAKPVLAEDMGRVLDRWRPAPCVPVE